MEEPNMRPVLTPGKSAIDAVASFVKQLFLRIIDYNRVYKQG